MVKEKRSQTIRQIGEVDSDVFVSSIVDSTDRSEHIVSSFEEAENPSDHDGV